MDANHDKPKDKRVKRKRDVVEKLVPVDGKGGTNAKKGKFMGKRVKQRLEQSEVNGGTNAKKSKRKGKKSLKHRLEQSEVSYDKQSAEIADVVVRDGSDPSAPRKFFLGEETGGIPSIFVRVFGVLITTVFHGSRLVAVVVEGAYRARAFLTLKLSAAAIEKAAPQEQPPIRLLLQRGKYLSRDHAMEALEVSDIEQVKNLAPYVLSNTSASLGSASVLLFGVSEQCNSAFERDVYQVIRAFFDKTKDYKEDITAAKFAERTIEEAKEVWKASPAWTVTMRTHKLANGAQDDALAALLTYDKTAQGVKNSTVDSNGSAKET